MSTPALSTGSALQIDDIDFSFAARSGGVDGPLYKEFSLHIEQGSIVAIMGASGAGKTTLGRIMAGILTAPPEVDNRAFKTKGNFHFRMPAGSIRGKSDRNYKTRGNCDFERSRQREFSWSLSIR